MPWIAFLKSRGGKKLSDIEYLSIKEFGSKLVKNDGSLSATGDLCSITAASGKDMYLASAKINVYAETDNIDDRSITVVLKAGAAGSETIVETFDMILGRDSSGTNGVAGRSYEFNLKGIKVTTTQNIQLEVTVIEAGVGVNGQLTCFEEATGATPQVTSI